MMLTCDKKKNIVHKQNRRRKEGNGRVGGGNGNGRGPAKSRILIDNMPIWFPPANPRGHHITIYVCMYVLYSTLL